LLPVEIEELFDVIAEVGSLRFKARKIKDDLPFILRTNSAEGLSELSARLWECAGLARKVAELRSELALAVRLITELDKGLSKLAGHVEDMQLKRIERELGWSVGPQWLMNCLVEEKERAPFGGARFILAACGDHCALVTAPQ
jgi:hypothetical protein